VSERIKEAAVRAALQNGAVAVRVCDAVADATTHARLQASFRRGDLQTWRYDDAHARKASDPKTLLPDARSVVCIAVPYATTAPRAQMPLQGRVSNYAWSADYHYRLREMLQRIAAAIDDAAGAKVSAIACDTKPLAERALAARSGLGWVGKHTNLIAPGLGSFVFLGEVITSVHLPADEPSRKSCGTCDRCVDACPTGALRGDYTMDANRCIADLTQRTDGIPIAMRPLVGDWVWGCDLCQTACPPTQRAGPRNDERWAPLSTRSARPWLLEMLSMRSATFKRHFRDTAMGWRGAAVLRRNAAVALGNALDRSAAGALARSLTEDPHPMVRAHAAWALGRLGSPAAEAALRGRRGCDPDDGVCQEIEMALRSLI
jgi:epoxyqueuosine reductase